MDFVSAWKIIAIALTGFFGVLGLITEFKDKSTGQITKWGKFSLLSIVVSTFGGAAAQLKEFSDQQVASAKSAKATFEIVEDIRRAMTSIEDPTVTMTFTIPCDRTEFKEYCNLFPQGRPMSAAEVDATWNGWPLKGRDGTPYLPLQVRFFRDEQRAEAYLRGERVEPNLFYTLSPAHSGSPPALQSLGISGQHGLYMPNYTVKTESNDGTFVSMRDFPGSTLPVSIFFRVPCIPASFALATRSRLRIGTDGGHFRKRESSPNSRFGPDSVYQYTFPQQQ